MLTDIACILIGIALLIWSADKLTDGAAAIATNYGVPKLIVGLTIIAIGSSAPEMVVSAVAAIGDSSPLAIGNALGSNIVNIALVLSITTLITPLLICSNILKREMPLLIILSGFGALLLWDGYLSRIDGYLMIATLIAYLIWLVWIGLKSSNKDIMLQEMVDELPAGMSNRKAIFWVIMGLIVLIISSDLLVMGATHIALTLGISELAVGVTIVAIGTSLPELAASIAGAMKKEHDMVIGNIIGSNIFNILGVLGIAGIIAPTSDIPDQVFTLHLPAMLAVTIGLYILSHGYGKDSHLGRKEALVLLAAYILFDIILFINLDMA